MFVTLQPQLLDILGAAQTDASHAAFKEIFKINSDNEVDNVERYLQALAVATRPSETIIADLLVIATQKFENDKIQKTLIHTIGSLAYRFGHLPENSYNHHIVRKVRIFLTTSLKECKYDSCLELYLNGLRNLQSPETVEQLLEHVLHPERSVSVAAMKALRFFPSRVWTKSDLQHFRNVFYQRLKRFDSSARTLALDILLEAKPNAEELRDLLLYLKSNDKAYEVKKYLLEKVTMLANKCSQFHEKIREIIQADLKLQNYHILGQKGNIYTLARVILSVLF